MYDMDQTDMSDVEFALSIVGEKPKRVLEVACPAAVAAFLCHLEKLGIL